jgi:hypothetical protein
MDNSNKIKRLQISGELLRSWFTEGEHELRYRIRNALPADAEIINARVDWAHNPNVLDLIIRSESFPEVQTLDKIPVLVIKIATLRVQLSKAS